jgi:hypothetical protein
VDMRQCTGHTGDRKSSWTELYNTTDALLKLSTLTKRVAHTMLTSNVVSRLGMRVGCCSRQISSAKLRIGRTVISDVKPSTDRTGNIVAAIHTTQVGSSVKLI